jgi:hypothetical protein
MAVLFSTLLGELYRRTASLWPGAVVCGVFFSYSVTFPVYLMKNFNIPLAGPFGYISAVVWLLALLVLYRFRATLLPPPK